MRYPESRRPTLYGSRQAVSSGHYLATAAGQRILDAGGNAIDAGVAAGIALGVLHSNEVNVAGVAPILIRTSEGRTVSIAGLGHWPAAIPPDIFAGRDTIPEGVLRTVVPSAPSAWITALRDFGTMSFGEVAADAIRFAAEGFAVYDYFHADVTLFTEHYRRWAANRAIYLTGPDATPLALGERVVQSDLARALQYMADAETAASGDRLAGLQAAHDAFYTGDIADAIVAAQVEHGGYLSHEDLRTFAAPYEDIVTAGWRDFEVVSCGPWSQGPVLLQALRMLERHGLDGYAHDSADYAHLLIEVMKAAFSDREYRYGDPRFVDVRMDELLSDAHADSRLAQISEHTAHPTMFPPIGAQPGIEELIPAPTADGTTGRSPDTSYLCVVDRWGNAFSATPSDGSHASPVVDGWGIVPSARGSQSRPDPRHPSGFAPGKRPRLTPNPALAIRDDGSILTFGCPGGDMQVQAMLQVFLNCFHFGMDIQEAIDAPRIATWSFPNSFSPFEYLANRVALENRFPPELAAGLRTRGHDVREWEPFTRSAAAVEAIYLDASSGFLRAGADPRQPAYAVVS